MRDAVPEVSHQQAVGAEGAGIVLADAEPRPPLVRGDRDHVEEGIAVVVVETAAEHAVLKRPVNGAHRTTPSPVRGAGPVRGVHTAICCVPGHAFFSPMPAFLPVFRKEGHGEVGHGFALRLALPPRTARR